MKLRLPLALRKALTFCALACTVQAQVPEDLQARGGVVFVFHPEEEKQSSLVADLHAGESSNVVVGHYGYVLRELLDGEGVVLEYDSCALDFARQPGVVDPRYVTQQGTYCHPAQRKGRTLVYTRDENARAVAALERSIDAVLGTGPDEDRIYVDHRGKGYVRRAPLGNDTYPFAFWDEEAWLHGDYLIPVFYHMGYSAIWVGGSQRVYYHAPASEPPARPNTSTSASNTSSTPTPAPVVAAEAPPVMFAAASVVSAQPVVSLLPVESETLALTLAISGATSLTWTAGSGGSLTWSDGGAWNDNTFTNGSEVIFQSSSGSVDNETVTLGGDVKTGKFTVSGVDNYTFALADHKITIGGKLSKTGNGTLVFANGSIELASGADITANNIEFRNVTFTDKNSVTGGNTINITTQGTFKMVGGTASIVKINANNNYSYKETHVILTDGANLSIKRNSSIENSGLEAAYVEINRGATLSLTAQDSLKVEHIWMDGTAADGFSGATLNLTQSLLRANKAANSVYFEDVDITLKNGAVINNGRANGSVFDLTLHSKNPTTMSPNLNLTLQGDTSYITGAFSLSHLQTMALETADSYLTIGNGTDAGSLNLTNTITATLTFNGSTLAADTDYAFIHVADGSSLLVNGEAVIAGVDYLSALKIGTVTVGGQVVTGNEDYDIQVVRVGDNLVLRVLDANRTPSAGSYVWSNAHGAAMGWSYAGWHEQVWTDGSAVSFISDSVEGVADTAVAVRSDVTVTSMKVSGEDNFAFDLGSNTITAATLTKSASGAMSLENGTLAAQSVTISGGTLELGTGATLSTPAIAITGGSVQVRATGNLVTPSVSVSDGGSLSISGKTISFADGVSATNGSVQFTDNSKLTTSAITLAESSSFSATGGTVTVNGDISIADSSFTLDGNAFLTADNLTMTGADSSASFSGTAFTGSANAAKRHITINHTVDITGGTFTLGENIRLTTQTINLRDGARLVLEQGATLYPLPGYGNLNLFDGAILHSGTSTLRDFAANNIDIVGSTVYWTGNWKLEMGNVSTMTFGDDGQGGSFVTIGTADTAGVVDFAPAGAYSELQLTTSNWDPTNARTDYILFHRSENGTMTMGGGEIAEHTNYIPDLKLNQVSVINPATEDTELERVIENLINNDLYNTYIVRVGDDMVLRVVDKNHAPKEGGYHWYNNKDGYGDAMNWSVIGWQNEAWFSGSDVYFESDGVEGSASTTATIRSDVTAGTIYVSGEDGFTISQNGFGIGAATLNKSGSGTLTISGTTPLRAETVNITGGTVRLTGGNTTGGSGASLAVDTLNIKDATLVLDAGSQLSIYTPEATKNLAINLDGATLTNTGDASLPFRGWGNSNRIVTITPTGSASTLSGKWNVSSNFTLDASAADFAAPIIGGPAELTNHLYINKAGITINLGDKWDGVNSMAGRIKLFEVGENGAIKLDNTYLTDNRDDCISLLSGLQVNYTGGEGGSANVAVFNDAYFTDLVYEEGALYLNLVKKGEFVWANTDGAAMTWNRNRWGVMENDTGIAYREYEHVRFTGDGNALDVATTTVTIYGVGNPASDEDKTQNTFYIGNFAVEGEDNFIFHISGRMQMTGFEKHGSGTATLICDTEQYRPVYKVLDGSFLIDGGTVDASRTQLELENSTLTIDGTSGEAGLIAKFTLSGVDSFNLKNATVLLTGSGASAEVYKVGNSNTGGRRSSITVEKGARLSTIAAGSLSAQDFTVRSGGTITLGAATSIKGRTYTIESGGVLAINKTGTDVQDAFNVYAAYDPVKINLTDGGVLRNISASAPLRLNVVKNRADKDSPWRYSQVTLTLTGSASVLEGNWVLDASVDTVIRFADADTSALSIQNGTLNIINAASATETGALTFDLTGVWDGATPITQRLFRTVSGGSITMDGATMAAGDATSQFRNVYVRYGTGENDIINLSSASETSGSSSHYQLLWQNGSLFFTLAGQNENGPFIWRHSYETEYAPLVDGVQTGEVKLTWSVGEVWRPSSDTFGGGVITDGEGNPLIDPDTGLPTPIPAAIYKNGCAVSFVGDTDGVEDEVYVTIAGKVAPGDSTQGEAGIRITGADNYHFLGQSKQMSDKSGLLYTATDAEGKSVTVYRFGDEENGYYYAELDAEGHPKDTHYDSATPQMAAAEIGDYRTDNGAILPTTLSKSGSGKVFIAPSVTLSYTGRTEILEGKMEIDGFTWYPAGIITVAKGAELQVGQDAYMGTRRYNILSLGTNMVDNNGLIHTNILLTDGSTVTGEGDWLATYYMMNGGTSFRAGSISLQDVADPSYGHASLVADNTEIHVTGYVDAWRQNITLMNRSFMTVDGNCGKETQYAAVEADNIIISGVGSGLNFTAAPVNANGVITSRGTLRAQSIDLSHGAVLGLTHSLEHITYMDGDTMKYQPLEVNFGHGATLRNNGSSPLVLNPNNNADFSLIVKAKDEPNYFEGNWTVDLSHPFLLDFSYFDNDTTVVPLVIRDGTMTLANANQSLRADNTASFVFRADGLKYDTLEIMTVGERGKIALSYESGGKTNNVVLSNNMDYFSHLDSMGYWFHVDAYGNDTLVVDPVTGEESGWRYVDLVPYVDKNDGKTYYRGLNGTRFTEEEFMAYTGLTNGLNFKLLYESNTLSLVISPDGPIGDRQYYFWSGLSDTGSYKGPYGTWTRHNSVELSPWYGDDIFQNGYLTIFADVDLSGRSVGTHIVEIDNAVATGSATLKDGTRPGFTNAGIYFGNHSVAGYTIQSDVYHGSGYIADISESNITKITIDGGYVEIKTSNTYGGRLSQNSTASNYATTVKSSFITAADCDSVEIKDADGNVRTVQLSGLGVQDARAAGLVNYSRYAYAYMDDKGEVHFITNQEYQTGKYADKNPERVYITQRTDGSNMWSVRGETIPIMVKQNLAVVYETEVLYGYAFTETDTQGKTRLHFVSAKDYQDGTYADRNVMEVMLTPTDSNRVSWSITGSLNGSDFYESVAQSRLDMGMVQTTTSTYAFAYKNPADNNRYAFITEQEYQLWNAWTEAPEANKATCLAALRAANAGLADFAEANPDVLVEQVSVVRTVNSSTPSQIRWTVGGEGGQVVNFQEFPFNQIYAYKMADGSVHVLSQTEYNTWMEDKTAFGHDVQRVGVFGPVNNEWGLYTINEQGNKEKWGTIYERPQVYDSSDAYLRTPEQYTSYAYLTTSEGSTDLNHAHLISEQEYNAWTAWLDIDGENDPMGKEAAFNTLQGVSADLAALASANPTLRPEPVKLNRYANEQTYRVTGSAIRDNLSTRGVANNFTYAYTTSVHDEETDTDVQQINFLTQAEYGAWKTYNDVLTDASATAEQKDAAFAAFSDAVGSGLATSIRDSAVLAPERVDLAYFTQTDNGTGNTSSYWAIRGDHITGTIDSLVGEKTYGAAFVCVYKDTLGNYHAISQEDYQNWKDGKVDAISDTTVKNFATTHTGVDAGYTFAATDTQFFTLSEADCTALQGGDYAHISNDGLRVLARTYTGTASGYAYQDAEGNYHTLSEADFTAWNEGRYGDMTDAGAQAFAQANTDAAPVYSIQGSGRTDYLSQADYTALQGGYYTSISEAGLQAIAQTHTATGEQAYLGVDWQSYTLSQADYKALQDGRYSDISTYGLMRLARTYTGAASGYAYQDAEGNYHTLSEADFTAWNEGRYGDMTDAGAQAFAQANTDAAPVYSIQGSGDHVGYISQADYAALKDGNLATITASGFLALAETHTAAVSGYAYQDANGVYHTISEADYAKWQAGNISGISDTEFKDYATAHTWVNPVVVNMSAESTIHVVNNAPTSDTVWTLTAEDGTVLSFANVGGMDALSGKVYSYAYTNVDSLGRSHIHFISAEDFANGTYAEHNPLLVTLSNNGSGVTYSWDVRGTSANSTIDDNVSTRTFSNNYVYAYKTVDGEGNEQITFVTAEAYRSWNAEEHGGITPERVDLSFCSSTDDYGVETTWWQLKGATIDTTKDSMAGIETYGAAFLYAQKDATTGKYTFLTQEQAFALNETNPGALVRVEMIAESVIGHTADGTPTASLDWLLRVPGTDENLDMSDAGGMSAIAGKVYGYAYRGEDGTLQFITAADYAAGIYADKNPECVALSMVVSSTQPWSVLGGGIDVIVDVSDIPVNSGTDVYTDTKTEHYTYVVVVRDDEGQISGQFISERDVNDGNFPANALRGDDGSVNVQRLTLVQQQDGKWFVPEKGYTMAMETLEVTVDTENFFGYGYYDAQGRLHLTSQDTYYADNGSQTSGLEGKESPLGNTQLIRLAYDKETGRWYTPGVLIASNEHALGTSEVFIGTGSRLLATTNLFVTSLTLEGGANVIAHQNLDINKPLVVTSGSYFETDGTLTVANITVEKGSHFVTNNVKATNVTIKSGALWNLNSSGQSVLDISDRLIIYGGSEITGNALLRDGMLELFSGDADNPYVTITGSLKIGVDATLDLTKLMSEGADHHYRSPLRVSEGGRLELEPHAGVMLSMDQANHMLMDHNGEIPQSQHVMHIATLGAGANFYITNTTDLGNGELSSTEVPLPTTNLTSYDGLPTNVELAEGLGYLLNSTLIRRHIETGSEAGLDEIVLHIGVKEDAPAFVWDGHYNGRDATDNDNLWCMYNGGTLVDEHSVSTTSFAWSGHAIYGDPTKVLEEGQYNNWGREVYFLEVGFDSQQKAAFTCHYVNAGDKADTDLTNRAKYVDISGPVWSNKITVDVDRLYDLTLDQYLRNVGYLFYTSDGTGTITDCYVNAETGAMVPTSAMSADMAAQNGYVLQQTNIVKNGTGVLTLSTENSFSGTVYLNSGSVFATNEKALGTSHVKMMDSTGLYINFLFEMKGDSNYRNPVLPNEITVWGGGWEAAERAVEGSNIISVTVGYNPISVIDVMCDLQGGDTSALREESTSRHWRTLAITGPLHGGKNTEITLQGYTSYTGSTWYTSMFYVYGSEGLSDFAGTIKLQNYRNLSPAAYSGSGSFMDDTNKQRGTGPVELMLSDGSLQYATLDLTRANVLASYTKENGEQGFGRRQTPIHIVLLRGDSAVAGLNADFLGTIVRAVRLENGTPHSGQVEILVATQGQELACVRTIAVGNYTFSLHSEEMEDFVYSGVLGGRYAYAGQGSGTIPEAGEDASGAKSSDGMISLVHTGNGAQYVHTGYLQDLTIGNEAVGTYQKATGGTVGFHYLDLQGNLSLHSGATLMLDVDDCVRTANADGSQQEVHWDESAFSSSSVELHPGKHATVITSSATPGTVNVYDKSANNGQGGVVSKAGLIPVGSTVDGSLVIDSDSHLDFFSRGIEPLAMPEGGSSPDLVKTLTAPTYHTEVGQGLNAPETGYLLDVTGQLVLKGEVHVDFAGVEFTAAHNGMTYYLARAQQGIIGTVTQQTISLGNGYYGIVRGLQTYKRDANELILPSGNTEGSTLTFVPAAELKPQNETRLSMDSLTSVSVNLTNKEGSTDYFFEYVRKLADGSTETKAITLTQVAGNIYSYEVGGDTLQTTISTNLALGEGRMLATLNLLPLAYEDAAGYIIMTVTNTPPRVWFNTANVMSPVNEITLTEDGEYINGVMVTPNGTHFYDGQGGSAIAGHNAIDFGDTAVDTLWTNHGPTAHSWIDEHDDYGLGCRVQFNKYGTCRYLGQGLVDVSDQEAQATHSRYLRGGTILTYNPDKDEYGMYVTVETGNGNKVVWRGMVAEMYGEQFDIVELEGDVQARSIFVDCEKGISANDGTLLVNSRLPEGHVNYWFRSAETDDTGRIGDIEVTDVNHEALTAKVYDVKIGQILAVSVEKTGSGYLRISTHNSYSGGTYLKQGTLIIDCDDALGKASLRQDAGGGDGALHAYDGSSLFLNYVGSNDTSTFSNKINVYANTAARAEDLQAGFTISNGINLNGKTGSVHFVVLDGAIIAADPDAVITLSGVIVAENDKSYRDYTSFTISNLENYSGVVRMDSTFSSNAEGVGMVDGIVVDANGQIVDYVRRDETYFRPGSSTALTDAQEGEVIHYYDEATRRVFYYLDETDAQGKVTRTTLTRQDVYFSAKNGAVYDPSNGKLVTGGEVGLRITGSTLGEAIVDLSLNNAYHNALVLDMSKAKSGSTYELGGVRGLVGGELTYITTADKDAQGNVLSASSGWQGYNSNVVSAKHGEKARTILSLDVAYGDALYAGTVGYGYYHATEGENVGLVHPSAAMSIEKNGSSTQSIFSARLDGLTINQGNIHFVQDVVLSGKLSIAKESQLIIGTPGTTTQNFNVTNGAPYSIVVQGQGILALGNKHTKDYTTQKADGGTFTVTTHWTDFTTDIRDFSEDMTPNALFRGGTLTAITDVGTGISARFENTFTIDTSHYNYENASILEDEGMSITTVMPTTHTITLSGRLYGTGVVTVTGGGTLEIAGSFMEVYDTKEKKVTGQMIGYNAFAGTKDMLIRVQDATTLSINKDSALAYYGAGYSEQLSGTKHQLVANGSTGWQGASTLEVCADSRAVVENGIHAQIAAARFVDNGIMEVGTSHSGPPAEGGGAYRDVIGPLATVGTWSWSPSTRAAGLLPSGSLQEADGDPASSGAEVYGVGGDPATLNVVNVTVSAVPATETDPARSTFIGIESDVSENCIFHNAKVEISASCPAEMSNLTLGSALVEGADRAQQDNTLVELKGNASVRLENVVVQNYAEVHGQNNYTGQHSTENAEVVELNQTYVVAELGKNLLRPGEDFIFTGEALKSNVDYTQSNTAEYTYSQNSFCLDVGQDVYTLTNFQNTVITGGDGALTLLLSQADYEELIQYGARRLVGIYMPGVAIVTDGVSENLINFAVMDARGDVINQSVFWVTANTRADGSIFNHGTVFYIDTEVIPEPATGTLSILALAALCARRRRRD